MSGWWLHACPPRARHPPVYVDEKKDAHLEHGRTAATARWDASARRLRLRVRRGVARVRTGPSRRFQEIHASDRDVEIRSPGRTVIALDARWVWCYVFHEDETMPRAPPARTDGAPGADLRRCLRRLPLSRDMMQHVESFLDWSEEWLCTLAVHAVLELDGAWSEFEALHLQLGRARTPCSPWHHLPASLSALGVDADDGICLAWEHVALRSDLPLRQQPCYRHRGRVVEWMMRQADRLQLSVEALHRGVHILDRYMRRAPAPASRMQALGAAALVLGSKYEGIELTPQEVHALSFSSCPRFMIRAMEWRLFQALGYTLGGATALCWVRHLLRTKKLRPVQRYLLDQSLLDGAALELTRPELARQLVAEDRLPQLLDRLQLFSSLTPTFACTDVLLERHNGRVELRGVVPLQLYCRAEPEQTEIEVSRKVGAAILVA